MGDMIVWSCPALIDPPREAALDEIRGPAAKSRGLLGTRSVRMPDVDATQLHWAARRYLMERYDQLRRRYAELPNQGRGHDGYHYTREAKEIFPRYNVVQAMREEVERLDPDRLPDAETLGTTLARAAEVAQSLFTQPPQDDVQAKAIADERRLFRSTVLTWMSGPDASGPARVPTGVDARGIVGLAYPTEPALGLAGHRLVPDAARAGTR
jgi:hypothetical protein